MESRRCAWSSYREADDGVYGRMAVSVQLRMTRFHVKQPVVHVTIVRSPTRRPPSTQFALRIHSSDAIYMTARRTFACATSVRRLQKRQSLCSEAAKYRSEETTHVVENFLWCPCVSGTHVAIRFT